jgi:hypothetical protein
MKGVMKYVMLVMCITGITFISCKKDQQQPGNTYMGYDYFPNNVGHYVIYQCDSIIINPLSTHVPPFDTFHYQIKEVIDSIFLNNSGQPTQRIVRYKRTNDSIPWTNIFTSEKVWTGNLLSNNAQRQEDNYRYIKLVFPLTLNETWNGNAMNTLGTWNYQYTTLNTPATINGTLFDSTLTVMQLNNPNLQGNRFYEEQYATGVGLIYKEVVDWTSSSLSYTAPPPIDSATSGTVLYTETYLSSGN